MTISPHNLVLTCPYRAIRIKSLGKYSEILKDTGNVVSCCYHSHKKRKKIRNRPEKFNEIFSYRKLIILSLNIL